MLIKGEVFKDNRGKIRFVNGFDMSDIVRFYSIEPNIGVVRAWQGHKIEKKWFYVTKGRFLIKILNMNTKAVNEYTLTDADNMVLEISEGNYNGFEALDENSILLVFSNLTLQESKEDDYREDLEFFPW